MKHWRHGSINTDSKLEQVLTCLRPNRTLSGRVKMVALGAAALFLLMAPVESRAVSGAYVTTESPQRIFQFGIDPFADALTPLSPASLDLDNPDDAEYPLGIAISPDGRSAYVVITFQNRVIQYDIDPITGVLSPNDNPSVSTGYSPYRGIAVSPDGSSVYVTDSGEFDSWGELDEDIDAISQYDIDSESGELEPKNVASASTDVSGPSEIAVSPDGTSVYVTHSYSGKISQYNIDSETGELESKGAPVNAGNGPTGVAVSPDGSSLYATNYLSDNVSQYDIDSETGELESKGAPVDAGNWPDSIAVSPDGASAYVTNSSDDNVSQFDIDSDGFLTEKEVAPATALDHPEDIAVSPDGASAYVTNGNEGTVSQYNINPDGFLTEKEVDEAVAASGDSEIALTPNQGPTAAFAATSDSLQAAFDASGSTDSDGTVTRYDWDFGDGTTASDGGASPTHTYGQAGTYSVTLTVTDNEGCSQDVIFTGQTAYCNGSSTARTTEVVSVISSPENITPPVISGSLYVGQELTCSEGDWDNGPQSFSYQWLRNGTPISGEDATDDSDYTPIEADTGEQISCEVTATNPAGDGVAESESVEIIGAPSNTDPPVISGTPLVGQQLSCSQGTWTNDPDSYTFRWQRNGTDIIFATAATYALGEADAGSSITCTVTASNTAGSTSATSSAVSVAAPPSPSSLPGPAPSPAAQTAVFSEACNLKITSPKLRKTKNKVMRVSKGKARRLFTHGVKGTMNWGTVDGKDVVCKKIKLVILQQRSKNYYIPGTQTRVSKKILTRKIFSTQGSRFLKKRKVGKLRKKARSSKRQTKLSYKDFNRRSKLGRRALNNLRKKGYRGKFLVLYSAQIDGTTVLKKIQLSS